MSSQRPSPVPDMTPDDVVARLRTAGCVFAEEEARLLRSAAGSAGELENMVRQRVGGLPLEQIVGWAGFCGLRVAVEPGVFVPRQRTRLLVRQAALLARPGALVVDLCCGSGAVGAAVAAAVPGIELFAADIGAEAVRCAHRNLKGIGVVCQGDLFEALPGRLRGRVDVLVANAPYVPTAEIALMPPEARLHEPLAALDGGSDGLAVQRRIVAQAPEWLSPGGALLVETSRRQAPETAAAFVRAGLPARTISSRTRGGTVVVGTAAAGSA